MMLKKILASIVLFTFSKFAFPAPTFNWPTNQPNLYKISKFESSGIIYEPSMDLLYTRAT